MKKVLLFNGCKIYTKTLQASELCKANGIFIDESIWDCNPRTDIIYKYNWPKVKKPNEEAISIWKQVTILLFCDNKKSETHYTNK